MPLDFLGKKLLVLTAHPDDESFLAAGTLYKNHKQGGQNVLLCASFGEKGDAFLKRPMKEIRLRALRKKEMERAAKFLGVRELVILGLPDTKVRAHKKKILAWGLALAKRHKPDAIISFGTYGMSGHHDHVAMGEVAKRLARACALTLYTFTLSAHAARMWVKHLKKRTRAPIYTKKKPTFEKPSVTVPVDRKIKVKVLMFYASQLGGKQPFHQLPAVLRRERLTLEHFHVANAHRVKTVYPAPLAKARNLKTRFAPSPVAITEA